MQNDKLAKRAIKISIVSLFILLLFALILISIAVTQAHAIAQMSQKMKILEAKIQNLEQIKPNR